MLGNFSKEQKNHSIKFGLQSVSEKIFGMLPKPRVQKKKGCGIKEIHLTPGVCVYIVILKTYFFPGL